MHYQTEVMLVFNIVNCSMFRQIMQNGVIREISLQGLPLSKNIKEEKMAKAGIVLYQGSCFLS